MESTRPKLIKFEGNPNSFDKQLILQFNYSIKAEYGRLDSEAQSLLWLGDCALLVGDQSGFLYLYH